MEKTDARKLTQDAQEIIREKAVRLVLEGKRRKEVAEIFHVSTEAIRQWVIAYRKKGPKGLKKAKRGRRPGGKLKNYQAATICNMIRDRNPDELKLPFYLWTAEAVRDLIKRRYGIKYGIRQVQRYLEKWGYTPQKPKRVVYEQDREEVEKWMKKEYPAIKGLAKREKARIYWGDEMGVRSDYQAGRSYSVRGQTPVINGTGKRFGCNIVSAITNKGNISFMVFKSKFNREVFRRFLEKLLKNNSGKKIFLIVDSHPVHRSSIISKWVKMHKEDIRMYFLPAYSPDLNPDEFLNHDVKANSVGKKRPETKNEMMGNVRNHLNRCKRNPGHVKNFFQAESVKYAS